MIKQQIFQELKSACESENKRRACTLRLVKTAIKDRESAAREAGKEGLSDAEVADILKKMVEQRVISTKAYEEAGKLDEAEQEQEEIAIIESFLPQQMTDNQIKSVCKEVVNDLGATSLKDIPKAMSELKEKFPGQMDFTKANKVVREMVNGSKAVNGTPQMTPISKAAE